MKKQFILAASCLLPLATMAQQGFTIKGKIGKLNAPAKAYLNYTDDGRKVADSALLKNGQFTFKGQLKNPTSASIVIRHDTGSLAKNGYMDYLQFYIENANITVTSPDSVFRAAVKGSKTNDEDRLLAQWRHPYKRSADSLTKVYWSLTAEQRKDTLAWLKPAGIIMRQTQAGYDSVSKVFLAKYPTSYIALRVFQEVELSYNFNPDTAAVKFARFPASMRNSALGKQLQKAIETGKKTNTGVMAMDFEQKDSTGKSVKLSDFRGQYVLVDFWASWCKPCRAENPNLLAAYNKFKDKKFTILGVSLDEENGRKAWLGAVKQDNMPWTQISDLKGFNSEAAVLYGIKAIPSNFLIDPSGKIIARNLRGDDLSAELAKILK
ncbi:AhpC/TSA family protein [Chitinophaga sedimenti]|uniref:TlpA disulfide reductase family protein n=1 Tax=Chitinophaga sedimenti TaxID=2033606 RepID=UPI002004469E|nr:TlpA disulfide reductase family protein [Chitinophaga sedimenti]MCK7556295.1 AhpC/TSA family protein [Chitinophaga sedimenti]